MNKDTYAELFEKSMIGHMSYAFLVSGVDPGEYWPYLRGEKELTTRIMGEILYVTDLDLIFEIGKGLK